MKKIMFSLIILSMVYTFGQNKMYIWKNSAITDSMDITNDLKISFKATTTIPTEGLVAYYPFDGNANDSTGNGYNGTITGATFVPDRLSRSNRALYFPGNGVSYVTTSNSQNIVLNDSFSVCFWIKFVNAGSIIDRDIIGTYTTDWFINSGNSGSINISLGTSAGVSTNKKINDSAWHHIVCLRNKSTGIMKIYVDGMFDNQGGNWFNNLTGNAKINFGAMDISSSVWQGFTGSLDEIRFYARELSTSEIQALYNQQ